MNKSNIYATLKDAYTPENLTAIASTILQLYHAGNTLQLQRFFYTAFGESADHLTPRKMLSKLMMHYHPDRSEFYLSKLEASAQTSDNKSLGNLMSILKLKELNIAIPKHFKEDSFAVDEEEYMHEPLDNYGSYFDNFEEEENVDYGTDETEGSFYTIFKRHWYGQRNIELPYFMLEDLYEIELPGMGIQTLDGIEYCLHVERLELSQNNISDIRELEGLLLLQELYLAENNIYDIDTLAHLVHLQIVDISENPIDNATVLFYLDDLKYLNLSGTKIPKEQIEIFRNKGIIVVE